MQASLEPNMSRTNPTVKAPVAERQPMLQSAQDISDFKTTIQNLALKDQKPKILEHKSSSRSPEIEPSRKSLAETNVDEKFTLQDSMSELNPCKETGTITAKDKVKHNQSNTFGEASEVQNTQDSTTTGIVEDMVQVTSMRVEQAPRNELFLHQVQVEALQTGSKIPLNTKLSSSVEATMSELTDVRSKHLTDKLIDGAPSQNENGLNFAAYRSAGAEAFSVVVDPRIPKMREKQIVGELKEARPVTASPTALIALSPAQQFIDKIPEQTIETPTATSMNMPRASNTSARLDTPIANQPTDNLEASLLQKTEELTLPVGDRSHTNESSLIKQSQSSAHLSAYVPAATIAPTQTTSLNHVAQTVDTFLSLRDNAGQIEVALKPEDLGRLAIKLEHTANGTNIVFIAERAETQDLMRRQMEFLHQQFKNLGHENLTFTFTSPQDQALGDGDHSEDTETLKSNETEMLLAVNLPVSSGLDIRI